MKRTGRLFEKLVCFANLLQAAKKARKGCGRTRESCRFVFNLESEIFSLQDEIASGRYRPGDYRYFFVKDPKERLIAVAPFRDRVVHHALVNVTQPVFEPRFIFDSYATRPEKGTHAAVIRAQSFLRKNTWFLKADVHKFFDSVRHDILMAILVSKIKDQRFLNLMETVVKNTATPGVGLPIGNLTSQFLANVFMDPFDHYVKDHCRFNCYIRYMDDFVFFSRSKGAILKMHEAAGSFLDQKLGLELKPGGVWMNRSAHGLSFLGNCIYPGMIRVRGENYRRSLKRIKGKQKAWQKGDVDEDHLATSLASSIGHLRKFNPSLPVGQ